MATDVFDDDKRAKAMSVVNLGDLITKPLALEINFEGKHHYH